MSSVIFSLGAEAAVESTGATRVDRIIAPTTDIPSMTLLQMGHGALVVVMMMIARGEDRSAIATFSTATERSNTTAQSTGNPFPAISSFPGLEIRGIEG